MKIDIAGVGKVTLIMYAKVNDGAIVLVDRHTDYEPYVTWVLGEDSPKAEAFWGHYFSDRDTALLDFHDRANTTEVRRNAHERVDQRKRAART